MMGRNSTAVGCSATTIALVIATIDVATSLPNQYLAQRWQATWVGIDIALTILSLAVVISALRDSSLVVPLSAALSILLAADAWFDCLTADTSDLARSLTLLLVEIPASAFFAALSVTTLRRVEGTTKRNIDS